jgi:uncharacterized protein (DUF1015 family)
MARIAPFQPYRYSPKAGDIGNLATQPYDKISPEMRTRYLSLSPYNLVRVILGEPTPSDGEKDNVYTRAAKHFSEWTKEGILVKDQKPAFYAYFQQFVVPDTGETLVRKGFIGLTAVEDYSQGTVHRHEQTLSGPKKDRRLVLEHTRAHFGQIFLLYADPECRTDAILNAAASGAPAACVRDEYETTHSLYAITDPGAIAELQALMGDKKLLIADGHHRYETALAFRDDHPKLADAKWVMATFVNMHSPGLRILATHRVMSNLPDFDPTRFLKRAGTRFRISKFTDLGAMTQVFEQPAQSRIRIGIAMKSPNAFYMLERDREAGALDVDVLHRELIEGALGIDAEAVREQKFIKYVRGVEQAAGMVADGHAQLAFLLEATTIQQVADTAFSGRVMPQKSTDFFPKLLSGLTIYRLEK